MQKITLPALEKTYCPFCGDEILNFETNKINQCSHTLLVAHDEDIEYASDKFKTLLAEVGYSYEDLDSIETSTDEVTDKIKNEKILKIIQYQRAPSFYGSYLIFEIPD